MIDLARERRLAYEEAVRFKVAHPRWDGRYVVQGAGGACYPYRLHDDGTARPVGETCAPGAPEGK